MILALLLCAAPAFDTFDGPLDPGRWYVGVPNAPRKGALLIPKRGWIVSRNIPADSVKSIEVHFTSRGGNLEFAFFTAREPLSSPKSEAIVIKKRKGACVLVVSGEGASLDGEALQWKGELSGTFRLRALKGAVSVDAVNVSPRVAAPPEPGYLEKRTVHLATTPQVYIGYTRVTLTLWDVEVCFLLQRKVTSSFLLLRAPPRGSPALAALATLSTGKDLAFAAGSHRLAMRDWGDERGNLSRDKYLRYLQGEYRLFEIMQLAQRAMNAAAPKRKELEALVHLAVIRHTKNTHAAVALAETQKASAALAALRKALDGDVGRASSDQLRAAAGAAARAILKNKVPAEWPGFSFDPKSRFVTIQQGKDLAR